MLLETWALSPKGSFVCIHYEQCSPVWGNVFVVEEQWMVISSSIEF